MGLRVAGGGGIVPSGGGQGGGQGGGMQPGADPGYRGGGGGNHFAGTQRDGGSQGDGGSGAFDFHKGFRHQQRQLAAQEGSIAKLHQELERTKSQAEGDSKVLARLREALTGGDEAAKKGEDPTKIWEAQLDHYLAEAVQAEKQGAGIPLTTNLAVHLFQNLIQHHNEKQEWQKRLDSLEAMVRQQADPQTLVNRQAFGQLDGFVRNGIDQLYGQGEQNLEQKAALFDAVGRQISAEIQGMSQKDPSKWDAIRRNPNLLQQMANRHLKSLVPPAAMRMIEEQQLKDTPMQLSELWQAFREAAQIQDPVKRQELQTAIRQDILVAMHSRGHIRVKE